jgi:hypothetical protein
MSPLTNTLHLQLSPMPHATSTVTTITYNRLQKSRILPTILFPTHRHPLEQSTTDHQSRPFPTDLQATSIHTYYKAKLFTYIPS